MRSIDLRKFVFDPGEPDLASLHFAEPAAKFGAADSGRGSRRTGPRSGCGILRRVGLPVGER